VGNLKGERQRAWTQKAARGRMLSGTNALRKRGRVFYDGELICVDLLPRAKMLVIRAARAVIFIHPDAAGGWRLCGTIPRTRTSSAGITSAHSELALTGVLVQRVAIDEAARRWRGFFARDGGVGGGTAEYFPG